MTPRARSQLLGCLALLFAALAQAQTQTDPTPARQIADEPVYVVTPNAVHMISEADLPTLRSHPCAPKGGLSFYRAPSGVADHCHIRVSLNGKVTNMASDVAGTAWDRTTGAATLGISVWAYRPRFAHMLLEGEYGGGSGRDGAFTLDYMIGHAFSVPGVALRGGTNVVLRGAPDYWHSRWELPALDLAWVLADGPFAAELGVRGALVTVGRFNLHDSSERLGGAILLGPYGVLAHRGATLRTMLVVKLSRIERHPPFHELDARFCSGTGAFMICALADQRWMAMDQPLWHAAQASRRATTLELSAGFAGL